MEYDAQLLPHHELSFSSPSLPLIYCGAALHMRKRQVSSAVNSGNALHSCGDLRAYHSIHMCKYIFLKVRLPCVLPSPHNGRSTR